MPASLDDVVAQWQQADASMQILRNQQQLAESYSAVSKQG